MPARLQVLASGHEIEVTIQEGKFHQVKRMFEAVGRKVDYLQRIRMGSLQLDRKLALGEYRALTESEIAGLQVGADKKQADIRLLALDVDGTLIKDDHTLSAKNIEAVRKVAARGVEVVLCTGRGTPNAWPIFEKLGLSGTMISHNGAATVHGKAFDIQAQLEIDQTSYVKLLNYLKQKQLYFDVNTANVLYVETVPDKVRSMYDLYEVEVTTVNDFLTIDAGVVKVTLYDEDPAVLDAFESQFKADWSDDELAMVRSGDYFIDFMRPNVNKGIALKTYAEAKGLVREQVVAIGNYNNDIEMLTYAGMGIAVANATSEVKQVSDLVVASNNDDGVSEAIALLFHDERG
jgi:Cof subfamily protein (haloacid dehalogenase superfamily)